MPTLSQRLIPHALAGALTLSVFSGCATSQTEPAAKPEAKAPTPAAAQPAVTQPAATPPAAAKTEYFFLVFHENGRIYPIADVKNYLTFLEVDELTYTRTRVGAGPEGETIVFGIEKQEADDLKKPAKAELIYDGKMEITGPFYAEVVKDGRFLVFGSWQDFKDYLVNKEITFTFTEIGTGPKGETVIYALNKDTIKEGRPVKLIEAFNNLRKSQ
jgi:hypothetical protein